MTLRVAELILRRKACLLLAVVFLSPMISGCSDNSNRPAKKVQTYADADGNLESITYMGRDVRDKDLKRLATDSSLKDLLIQECDRVTDQGFAAVAGSKSLTVVSLQHVPITDQGLESLSGHSGLEDVQLVNTKITGSGIQHLANVPLKKLLLIGDSFTSEGLAGLSGLDELQELKLQTPSAKLGDVPALGALKSLRFSMRAELILVKTGSVSFMG